MPLIFRRHDMPCAITRDAATHDIFIDDADVIHDVIATLIRMLPCRHFTLSAAAASRARYFFLPHTPLPMPPCHAMPFYAAARCAAATLACR